MCLRTLRAYFLISDLIAGHEQTIPVEDYSSISLTHILQQKYPFPIAARKGYKSVLTSAHKFFLGLRLGFYLQTA